MERTLGWVGLVAGVVVALIPVKARVLGTDVACGPAIAAVMRGGATGALCRTPAESWVLIAAVLVVAGFVAVSWGHRIVIEVIGWVVAVSAFIAAAALILNG